MCVTRWNVLLAKENRCREGQMQTQNIPVFTLDLQSFAFLYHVFKKYRFSCFWCCFVFLSLFRFHVVISTRSRSCRNDTQHSVYVTNNFQRVADTPPSHQGRTHLVSFVSFIYFLNFKVEFWFKMLFVIGCFFFCCVLFGCSDGDCYFFFRSPFITGNPHNW